MKARRSSFICIAFIAVVLTGPVSCRNETVLAKRISPEALAPRLLHDEAEMRSYLEAFPREEYKIYQVPHLGKFYLDQPPDVIKDTLKRGELYTPRVHERIRKYVRTGTTVIDVGAHIGTMTLTMGKCAGTKGLVYAFEPQKKLFREMFYNLKLNNIQNATALRFGLGDRSEVVEMGPAVIGNEGGTGVGKGGDAVELRTLDSFGFKNVSLIKIDVEGYEDFVLEGAKRTIAESYPVLIVVILGEGDETAAAAGKQKRSEATKSRIIQMGYQLEAINSRDYLGLPL